MSGRAWFPWESEYRHLLLSQPTPFLNGSMKPWVLTKVISGGQSGVDRAALDAAREAGLECGGWCPKGRQAEDGPIADHYPLVETPSEQYRERTEWNVRDSDGTLILTRGPVSGGTADTINMACVRKRPCRIVNLDDSEVDIAGAVQWLREHQIGVLNVAGPRESTVCGITATARAYLDKLFRAIARHRHPRKDERLAAFSEVDVYPVTCEGLSNGRSDAEVLEAVIAGGARIIQLRDKVSCKRELYRKAEHFRRITAERGVLLIINDHIDVARAIDADGVHLGQDDLPLPVARDLIPDKIIGASTHSIGEARIAQQEGADYINIGPIYATGTKENAPMFLGPQAITRIGPQVDIPFTVMGGIKLDNLQAVLRAGARRIAVVTAITQAADMAAATAEFRQRIRSYQEL